VVQATTNQLQVRLAPLSAYSGSTTLAGSRRMSGQSNVEDSRVAAAPKVTAPTANRVHVTRRSRPSAEAVAAGPVVGEVVALVVVAT